MPWYGIEHKTQKVKGTFVNSLDGIDPDKWNITKLSRKPTDVDDFIDGKIVKNKERAAKLKQNSKHVPTCQELFEMIEALRKQVSKLEGIKND